MEIVSVKKFLLKLLKKLNTFHIVIVLSAGDVTDLHSEVLLKWINLLLNIPLGGKILSPIPHLSFVSEYFVIHVALI